MAVPQHDSYAQLSGQVSEIWRRAVASEDREWLGGLFSGRLTDRGKLVLIAVIALLRGRHGRLLLTRLVVASILFVYNFVAIFEVICGFLVLAQLAARVIRSNAQGGRHSAILNSGASPSNDSDPGHIPAYHEKVPWYEHKDWPAKSLPDIEKSVVIHLQLPVYVWNFTFGMTSKSPSPPHLRRHRGHPQQMQARTSKHYGGSLPDRDADVDGKESRTGCSWNTESRKVL